METLWRRSYPKSLQVHGYLQLKKKLITVEKKPFLLGLRSLHPLKKSTLFLAFSCIYTEAEYCLVVLLPIEKDFDRHGH